MKLLCWMSLGMTCWWLRPILYPQAPGENHLAVVPLTTGHILEGHPQTGKLSLCQLYQCEVHSSWDQYNTRERREERGERRERRDYCTQCVYLYSPVDLFIGAEVRPRVVRLTRTTHAINIPNPRHRLVRAADMGAWVIAFPATVRNQFAGVTEIMARIITLVATTTRVLISYQWHDLIRTTKRGCGVVRFTPAFGKNLVAVAEISPRVVPLVIAAFCVLAVGSPGEDLVMATVWYIEVVGLMVAEAHDIVVVAEEIVRVVTFMSTAFTVASSCLE